MYIIYWLLVMDDNCVYFVFTTCVTYLKYYIIFSVIANLYSSYILNNDQWSQYKQMSTHFLTAF